MLTKEKRLSVMNNRNQLILSAMASLLADCTYLVIVMMYIRTLPRPLGIAMFGIPLGVSITLNLLFFDWLFLRKKLGWKYVCVNEIVVVVTLLILLLR